MSYDVNMRSLGGNIMATCMFIGNHESSDKIYLTLLAVTEELILKENVSTFYVGNNGTFDNLAQKALFHLKQKYPEIKAYTVLAYIPGKESPYESSSLLETLYPEGLEKVPPRYAINHRNRWMLERSSFVITHPSLLGNSLKLAAKARLSGKTVIDISQEAEDIFPLK